MEFLIWAMMPGMILVFTIYYSGGKDIKKRIKSWTLGGFDLYSINSWDCLIITGLSLSLSVTVPYFRTLQQPTGPAFTASYCVLTGDFRHHLFFVFGFVHFLLFRTSLPVNFNIFTFSNCLSVSITIILPIILILLHFYTSTLSSPYRTRGSCTTESRDHLPGTSKTPISLSD